MTWVKGPNGVVAGVSEQAAQSVVGDGSRGYSVVPDPQAQTEEAAPRSAPKKRAARKPKAPESE